MTDGVARPAAALAHETRGGVVRGRRLLAAAVVLAIAWAVVQSGVVGAGHAVVNAQGWPLFTRFFGAALHPTTTAAFVHLAATAAVTTAAFAVCGAALSLAIGVVGGVLSSEVVWRTVLPPRLSSHAVMREPHVVPWGIARGVLGVPRALHEVIWGLFLLSILGLSPWVAILAIGIPFGAITAKVYGELLDETARQPLDALRAAGAPPLAALAYGLVPHALPDLLSYAFYRLECSIRSAAVLGMIGAGGLGYEILLSLQSLRYEQVWTLLAALILLTGATDAWSGAVRRRIARAHEGSGMPRPRRDRVIVLSGAAALLALAGSVAWIAPDPRALTRPRVAVLLHDLAQRAFPPALHGTSWSALLGFTERTLAMSVLAITIAAAGGILLAFPAAHTLLSGGAMAGAGRGRLRATLHWLVFASTRALLLVLRAIPAPVWALVFLFVLFPGVLPGAVGLGVYTLGVLARLMAEVVEGLDPRPLMALRAQGATLPQVFLYGALPTAAPRFAAYTLYRWEVTIRETVMVGLVGAGGLGWLLAEQMSSFDYASVVVILVVYLLLAWLVDFLSAVARPLLR